MGVRHPEMAALQVQVESDELFASLVESQRHLAGPVAAEREFRDGLVFLQFNRCSSALRDALSNGRALQRCRNELNEAGFNFLLPCHNMIFVHPPQYQDARRANLPRTNRFYIIVAESLEYLVEECLDGAHGRGRGAWATTRATLSVRSSSNVANSEDRVDALRSAAAQVPWVIERTFLVFGAQVERESAVVQSTTEVHAGGMNPRRLLPSEM